jgi:hypothetical protein
MTLQTEYYMWHTKYHDLDPADDDTSSPWYLWVAQRKIDVRGLRTLEVACADAYRLDFSRAAMRIGYERSLEVRVARSVFLRRHTV